MSHHDMVHNSYKKKRTGPVFFGTAELCPLRDAFLLGSFGTTALTGDLG